MNIKLSLIQLNFTIIDVKMIKDYKINVEENTHHSDKVMQMCFPFNKKLHSTQQKQTYYNTFKLFYFNNQITNADVYNNRKFTANMFPECKCNTEKTSFGIFKTRNTIDCNTNTMSDYCVAVELKSKTIDLDDNIFYSQKHMDDYIIESEKRECSQMCSNTSLPSPLNIDKQCIMQALKPERKRNTGKECLLFHIKRAIPLLSLIIIMSVIWIEIGRDIAEIIISALEQRTQEREMRAELALQHYNQIRNRIIGE